MAKSLEQEVKFFPGELPVLKFHLDLEYDPSDPQVLQALAAIYEWIPNPFKKKV